MITALMSFSQELYRPYPHSQKNQKQSQNRISAKISNNQQRYYTGGKGQRIASACLTSRLNRTPIHGVHNKNNPDNLQINWSKRIRQKSCKVATNKFSTINCSLDLDRVTQNQKKQQKQAENEKKYSDRRMTNRSSQISHTIDLNIQNQEINRVQKPNKKYLTINSWVKHNQEGTQGKKQKNLFQFYMNEIKMKRDQKNLLKFNQQRQGSPIVIKSFTNSTNAIDEMQLKRMEQLYLYWRNKSKMVVSGRSIVSRPRSQSKMRGENSKNRQTMQKTALESGKSFWEKQLKQKNEQDIKAWQNEPANDFYNQQL